MRLHRHHLSGLAGFTPTDCTVITNPEGEPACSWAQQPMCIQENSPDAAGNGAITNYCLPAGVIATDTQPLANAIGDKCPSDIVWVNGVNLFWSQSAQAWFTGNCFPATPSVTVIPAAQGIFAGPGLTNSAPASSAPTTQQITAAASSPPAAGATLVPVSSAASQTPAGATSSSTSSGATSFLTGTTDGFPTWVLLAAGAAALLFLPKLMGGR